MRGESGRGSPDRPTSTDTSDIDLDQSGNRVTSADLDFSFWRMLPCSARMRWTSGRIEDDESNSLSLVLSLIKVDKATNSMNA